MHLHIILHKPLHQLRKAEQAGNNRNNKKNKIKWDQSLTSKMNSLSKGNKQMMDR